MIDIAELRRLLAEADGCSWVKRPDPGPVERLQYAAEAALPELLNEVERLRAENEQLRKGLVSCVETLADAIEYVPDYFRGKYGHDNGLKLARDALRGGK